MEITYNDLTLPDNLITFTDIPNILKVSDSSGGTYATLGLTVTSFKSVTNADGQWYITFMGETITNVLNPANAVNKNFYVGDTSLSTAASITKAFRNCPGIISVFNVEQNGSVVSLTAKAVGSVWTDISSDLKLSTGLNNYITASATNGTASSPLNGSLIDVDVFSNGTYITTLEKNWYNGEAAFNMSPVLTTLSKTGEAVPYTFKISSTKEGEYSLLGEMDANYSSVGYMCNQGWKYLFNDMLNIAQNYSRGAYRDVENNTILYVYEPYIVISFYNGNETQLGINVDYLDSAYNVISSTTSVWQSGGSSKKLWNRYINLNATLFASAFYVDVSIGSKKIRYNVIKPVKATEYCQRIEWRNSYGGISFFDFTGQKSENRDVSISTYQKNIFDYYTDERNELEKVYDNDVKYTVTLKSHLFENDGKYIFNDLIQSSEVWTVINDQEYAIIIDSVSVDETDNNNIYEATVKYHYSQEPSLI